MSLRCPSCKMESADDAAWCDFCKEPFRKAKSPAPPPAAPGERISEEELLKRLPPEFIRGDDGMKIPRLPRWLTWLAAGFLAFWLIMGVVLGFTFVKRLKEAPLPIPPPPTQPAR